MTVFTYLGWLYLNLKIRFDSWWNKKESEPSSLDTVINEMIKPQTPRAVHTTPRVRYHYNNYV